MKYNKEWRRLVEEDELFMELRPYALSYDSWKRRMKQPSVHFRLNWCLFLIRDCKAVDDKIFRPGPVVRLMCREHVLNDEEKLRVCDLNRRTLYKVCKRIDKKLGALQPGVAAMRWYSAALQDRAFAFLGGPELSRARLAQQPALTCPICLEDMSAKHAAVTACGHAFCRSCRGGLGRAGATACPMCRAPLQVVA